MSFRSLSTAAAVLCFLLSACLLFLPEIVYRLFAMVQTDTSDLLAKRAAMLFLGLGTVNLLIRTAPPSEARRAVSAGMAVAMAGLACMGVFEFVRGHAGPGIWFAVVIEVAFGGAFLLAWRGRLEA